MDFGYGLKKSGKVEELTQQNIEIIKGVKIHTRNAFGTFLKIDQEKEPTILVNHLMIQEDNNAIRDEIVGTLTKLGEGINCAVPSGETAIMNTLRGVYLGLSSLSFSKRHISFKASSLGSLGEFCYPESGKALAEISFKKHFHKKPAHYWVSDLTGKVIIPHADGVGTKSLVYTSGDYGFIQDAIAMNLNDILVAGLTTPEGVFINNTLILGKEYKSRQSEIEAELKEQCETRGIDIGSLSTVIMDNFEGVELDMVLTGIYDESSIPETRVKEGDVIIGIASNGIHSNGLTAARSYASSLSPEDKKRFYEQLAKPTIIYDKVFKAIEDLELSGAAHITGGAYTKLKKLLPDNLSISVNRDHELRPQDLFHEMYQTVLEQKGNSREANERMYSYFNCGVGLALTTSQENAEEIIKRIRSTGHKADIIGHVNKGKGELTVESMFDETITVTY